MPSGPACGLILKLIASFAARSWTETDGVAKVAGGWKIFKSITFGRGADWVMTRPRI